VAVGENFNLGPERGLVVGQSSQGNATGVVLGPHRVLQQNPCRATLW
jgi:hypothetical protein